MDRYAEATGNEADDFIAGKRVAAARKFNQAIFHSVDNHALGSFFWRFGNGSQFG